MVQFGRFDLAGLFGKVWFSLVNEDDLKRPLVPLKVAIFEVAFIFEVIFIFKIVFIFEVFVCGCRHN